MIRCFRDKSSSGSRRSGGQWTRTYSQRWKHLYLYAFPPFLLVGRTLQKIRREQVQRAVVIAPAWPTQPWFPLLLEMIVDHPIYLPQSKTLLQPPPIAENSPTTCGELSTSNRVGSVRNSLQKQGISQEAADIICSSWRKSTEKSYTSAWNKWSGWCKEWGANPFSASVAEIADFLTQFNNGKQYSTINSYLSAISNTHPQIDGYPVGTHPIICRLMQGVFNERPSEPKNILKSGSPFIFGINGRHRSSLL